MQHIFFRLHVVSFVVYHIMEDFSFVQQPVLIHFLFCRYFSSSSLSPCMSYQFCYCTPYQSRSTHITYCQIYTYIPTLYAAYIFSKSKINKRTCSCAYQQSLLQGLMLCRARGSVSTGSHSHCQYSWCLLRV